MGWACLKCTFLNERDEFLCCEMCSAEKQGVEEAPAPKRQKVVGPKKSLVPSRQPAMEELPVCRVGEEARCRELLGEHGVVVIRGAVSRRDVEEAESLFWKWLETHTSARRDAPGSLTAEVCRNLGYANTGVVNAYSIGHSEFLWRCRALVEAAWHTVWGNVPLITSFDGCGLWPNPYIRGKPGPFTDGRWYHLDQNFRNDPGFLGYQGLLNLLPQTRETGSTVVVPASHRDFEENCRRGNKPLDRGSFVRMQSADDLKYCDARARQVAPLDPGDVVVWDARVVHCSAGVSKNLPPTHPLRVDRKNRPLARLVAYIAMMPRDRLATKPRAAAERKAAVAKGASSGWNALVMRTRGDNKKKAANYTPPPKDDDPIWRLV
ncbi:hypothetical protein CTAYLR_000270 [Chrysophaeum taylorii]|uniref:Phytanoyl-CoA dioxygenase family protein n=1 Tax=Chrysophaeum taylorii TaxID=2483200 RepID=A0AAD7XJ15_9STRA|nr:hypothetical protein CTAYLR_000270 [Chrysophaeum taylorii]